MAPRGRHARPAAGAPVAAIFVTAHGFGHAARACALVEALHLCRPALEFLFVGEIPRWLLSDSLPGMRWRLREMETDVAPVQRTSLELDLEATRQRTLNRWPLTEERIDEAARVLEAHGARIVIADIAALGLLAGRRAGLPTVLVESFTWDWIYRRLAPADLTFRRVADRFEDAYAAADLRIQPSPSCGLRDGALQVGAIARSPRRGRERTRAELGVREDQVMALLSMGGVPWRYRGLETAMEESLRPVVVGDGDGGALPGIVQLPQRSRFHHPDLLAAADVVVGKLGYSTLAEAWQGGCAYLWVERTDFPEIPVLEAHARTVMPAAGVSVAELEDGSWAGWAVRLAGRARPRTPWNSGSARAAEAIVALL